MTQQEIILSMSSGRASKFVVRSNYLKDIKGALYNHGVEYSSNLSNDIDQVGAKMVTRLFNAVLPLYFF